MSKAVDQFLTDPDHSGLNLHPVKSDTEGRLYTFRASKELRVLLAKVGNLYVLIQAGHHDTIYALAERSRFVANQHSGFIGLVDVDARTQPPDGAAASPAPGLVAESSVARAANNEAPGALDHWRDADLLEAGLAPQVVRRLRGCSEDDLCELDLDDSTLELVIDLLEVTPEQWRSTELDPVAAAEARIREAIVQFGAVAGFSPLFPPEVVSALAAAPIEDWMVFLHPDQRALAERRYEGPARVRGSAGTGKTVVALHRASGLASRQRREPNPLPVLFTTFVRSLPPVFESLYRRLPGTREAEVEFVNIHKLALAVCRDSGELPALDTRQVNAAFHAAIKATIVDGSPLARSGLTTNYLRDEVTAVIKGRGIRSFDEYAAVERTGRGVPLGDAQRRQVWALHEEWSRQMARRGILDFPDVVLRARDIARRLPRPRYAAAIVDEAQDLTLAGLQLIRALVNGSGGRDVPDGLFIVGDGAQRIYPGGFTLRQAGIEVRGRTTVLRHNYRNTREISAAAFAVAGRETIDDLGEVMARGDEAAAVDRSGARPVVVMADDHDDELRFVSEQISRLVESGAVGFGDIAVAVATKEQVEQVRDRLEAHGVPVQGLDTYNGTPTTRTKFGTHFRSKGLEFKVVFLPFLGEHDFPRPPSPGQDPAEYEESRSLAVSQLYVAMTRARDGLFLCCSGHPSTVLASATDYFQVL